MLKLIYFLVIFLGILFRKSKIMRGIQYLLFWIIFALNSWNEDDINYQRIYSGYYGKRHEIGFDLLCSICHNAGVPYETFRLILVSISIILFLFAMKKLFPDAGNDGYSLILLYPMLALVELLRNFLSWAIVLTGIAFYFQKRSNGLKEKVIYAIIIIFASLFHYSALFFLVLLLDNGSSPGKNSYSKALALSIGSIVLLNLPIIPLFVKLAFRSEKVSAWFSINERIQFGIFIIIAFHLIQFFIYDQYYRNYMTTENTNNMYKLKMLYSMNLYSFALFGLYTYNFEFFSRIFTLLMSIDIMHISEMSASNNDNPFVIRGTVNEFVLLLVQLVFQIIMVLFFLRPFSQDGIMSMILNHNYLFGTY